MAQPRSSGCGKKNTTRDSCQPTATNYHSFFFKAEKYSKEWKWKNCVGNGGWKSVVCKG